MNTEQLQALKIAVKLLRELAKADIYAPGELSDDLFCIFCNATPKEKHEADCLWRRTREFCSKE